MKIKVLLSFLIIPVLFNISCKAPRNNINDPFNPDYNFGIIEGTVQSLAVPSIGLENVRVIWQNENLITETDINGRYRLNNIPIEDGMLIFSKQGYKSDTIDVKWGSLKRIFTQVFFNSIPVLDSVSIYTIVINQLLPAETRLFVKTWITDSDRDMDSVFIYNKTLNLRKVLTYFPVDRTYQSILSINELNVTNIEQTVGLDFSIITKDRPLNDTMPGSEFIIGGDRIIRVIKEEVSGLHPSTDSIITSQPVIFNWNEFNAGYNFTYLIEVYSYTTFSSPQLVHTKAGILSDSTSYTLPQILPNADYYWVIWVIDKYQNRSRSKQVAFRIR